MQKDVQLSKLNLEMELKSYFKWSSIGFICNENKQKQNEILNTVMTEFSQNHWMALRIYQQQQNIFVIPYFKICLFF